MRGRMGTNWWGVVLDSPDPGRSAHFYEHLLGWSVGKKEPGWVVLTPPEGRTYLAFHDNPDYAKPVWPPVVGYQQTQSHLDIGVADLDQATDDALAAGASLADYQPQDDVRVLIDPDGHLFCLYCERDPDDAASPI